jgi:hydroxypyruvate reductase
MDSGETLARELYFQALSAVEPGRLLRQQLRLENERLTIGPHYFDLDRIKHIFVIGAGKSAAAMAAGLETILGDRISAGGIIVKYGHQSPLRRITIWEAGHPMPDQNGLDATREILRLLAQTGPDDLVIALFSGGGSALLELPRPGLSLADLIQLNGLLLQSGATIQEINTVRQAVSAVKGGKMLAMIQPTPSITLLLSDVIGNDPTIIASGPTIPANLAAEGALAILERYDLVPRLPERIIQFCQPWPGSDAGQDHQLRPTKEPPPPVVIIGSGETALQAAQERARQLGWPAHILTAALRGEAREAGRFIASLAREIAEHDRPFRRPVVLLAGGETTVTIRGNGLGGRNQELALAAALDIAGSQGLTILAAGTDGSDGPTSATGAVVNGDTVAYLRGLKRDPILLLRQNDSFHAFEHSPYHLNTGPTRTNVMDIMIAVIANTSDIP